MGGELDSTANEFIRFIVDRAARMPKLIDDILLCSSVSARWLPFERVGMEKVFQEVLLNLEAATQETNTQLTCGSLPESQPGRGSTAYFSVPSITNREKDAGE